MKRILFLILVLAALATAAWWLHMRDQGTTLSTPLTDFAVKDTSRVDRIFISERDGSSVDLRRQPGGGWTVNGIYQATPVPVNLLLKTFLRVEVRAPVPKSSEENVLRVMSASAKRVEIYEGGREPSKIWYVGHSTKDHFGTYMLLEKPGVGRSNAPFVMGMSGFTGVLTTRFHTKLDEWRSTVVFDNPVLADVKEVRVEDVREPANSFRIQWHPEGMATLLDDAGHELPMDTGMVMLVMLQVKKQHFEYIERNYGREERDSIKRITPHHRVRIERRDGHIIEVPFIEKRPYEGQRDLEGTLLEIDADRMFAVVDDSLLVVVQRLNLERLLVPRSMLLR